MPRSDDKRARVAELLAGADGDRSTNWIARRAGVSWRYADKVREQLGRRGLLVRSANGRMVAARRKGHQDAGSSD